MITCVVLFLAVSGVVDCGCPRSIRQLQIGIASLFIHKEACNFCFESGGHNFFPMILERTRIGPLNRVCSFLRNQYPLAQLHISQEKKKK